MRPSRVLAGVLGSLGALVSAGAALAEESGPPQPPSPPPAPFTDVTAAAGIDFVHDNGAAGEKLLPETMGGGVAFLDYDRDGDQDLLFVDSGGWAVHSKRRPDHRPAVVLYANDGAGRFEDVTESAGLGVDAQTGRPPFYGQGVAAGDYDGDGWIDLYLTAVGPNRLLRNRQGVFEDVTAATGAAAGDAWSTCAAFFDADGDRDLDLYVCNYLSWSPTVDRGMDRTVTFADGGEGLTYGRPQSYRGAHPALLRNDSSDGGARSFTEVGEAAGLHVTARSGPSSDAPLAKALAVAPVDLDRDGRTDLLVSNDTERNFLFRNLGPRDGVPRFEEVGELYGVAYDHDGNATGAMGVDWGFLTGRGDGADDLALLVGNFAHEHTSLYRAQGDPTFFADEAHRLGLAAPTRKPLTFGLVLFDYDLDGRLDMLQVNGHVESDIDRIDPGQRHAQPAQLFWNTGSPAEAPLLAEVPAASTGDLARPLVGRGAAYADVDGDGDLDLVLTQTGGPAVLLRNDLIAESRGAGDRDRATGRRWLRLRLVDRPPNRDALGARVELTADGVTQQRQVMPTRSYLSQVELPVTFGLGDADGVDDLVVTWPDGTREEFSVSGVDRLQVLERGQGRVREADAAAAR